MLGAHIMSMHGHPPLLMDQRACEDDDDHCIAPFRLSSLMDSNCGDGEGEGMSQGHSLYIGLNVLLALLSYP